MQDKYYAVIDTNVIVSAILGASRLSIPTQVLKAVADGRIIPIFNNEILDEYREVLSRKKFNFRSELVDSIINMLIVDGLHLDRTSTSDETFSDPKDIVFYEVALSKDGSFLLTGNIKHFPQKSFVITPAEMIRMLSGE